MALTLIATLTPYEEEIADQVGGRSEFFQIQAALDWANSRTPTLANQWNFGVNPGTYDAEVLTLYDYVNLKGIAPAETVKVVKTDATAPIVTSAVTATLEGLTIGNGSAAQPAVKVTAGTLTLRHCTIYGTGTGDAIQMTGGALVLDDCDITGGDIDLSTGACTLTATDTRFQHTIDTSSAVAHAMTFLGCDFGGQNIVSAATGATTLTMTNCGNVATVSNAGSGAFTINDSHVATVTASSTGTFTIRGGYVGTCGGATASIVWWMDTNRLRVIPSMTISHAITAAATGDIIEVGAGTFTETLAVSKALTIVGIAGSERTTVAQADANVITITAAATIIGIAVNVTAATVARTGIICTTYSPTIRDCSFTQAGAAAGYGITCTTGSPTIDSCTFVSGIDIAVRQTGAGGAVVQKSRVLSGATHGVSSEGGTVSVMGTTIAVAGNGLNANTGTIVATNSSFTGTVVDINVAAASTVLVEDCAYNDVTNAGTFVDLTGCREYACAIGVAVGEWVYASAADNVAEAKSDALATMPSIGVVVYKPTTTTCKVKNYGYIYDSAAPWTAGQEYWISDVTAGAITTTMPGVWPQRAGVAVATNRFKVLIGDNLGLTACNTYSCAGAGQAVLEWAYISGADSVAEAKADVAATMNSIGMIVEKPTAVLAVVKTKGKVATTGKGWAANDPVYISDTTAGDIINAPPVMGITQRVGTVKSDAGLGVASGLIIEMM